uniref:Uncharacterized protein n=1 Tax=Oryza punctata TaxID=4537 RepID=A0A0E0MAH2_ORYPU
MRKAREEAATLAGRRKRSRGHALSRGDGSILDAMAPSKPLLPDFVAAVLSKTKTKSKNKAKPDTSGSNPCPGIQFTTEQNFPVSERSMAGPSYSVEKTITPVKPPASSPLLPAHNARGCFKKDKTMPLWIDGE